MYKLAEISGCIVHTVCVLNGATNVIGANVLQQPVQSVQELRRRGRIVNVPSRKLEGTKVKTFETNARLHMLLSQIRGIATGDGVFVLTLHRDIIAESSKFLRTRCEIFCVKFCTSPS